MYAKWQMKWLEFVTYYGLCQIRGVLDFALHLMGLANGEKSDMFSDVNCQNNIPACNRQNCQQIPHNVKQRCWV